MSTAKQTKTPGAVKGGDGQYITSALTVFRLPEQEAAACAARMMEADLRGEEAPITLDMASTLTSCGRVKLAAQKGGSIPVGWMMDRRGQPLTDPRRAADGFLLPTGHRRAVHGSNLAEDPSGRCGRPRGQSRFRQRRRLNGRRPLALGG